MAIYKIAHTEYKVDGTLKKKQGARIERFRKLLKQQRIEFTERLEISSELAPYDFSDEFWTRLTGYRKNGRIITYEELASIGAEGTLIAVFEF